MIRSRSIPFVCAGLLFSISFVVSNTAFAAASPAEELTRVLPDGVLGFVATSGGDGLEAGFEKSIMGRMWNDPSLQAFVKSIEQEIRPKLQDAIDLDPEAAGIIEDAIGYAKLALSRPIVAGIAQKQGGEGPPVFGFAILNAGPRKAEIASALGKLESLAGEGDIVDITIGGLKMHRPENDEVPLYWGWVGNHLVVAVNDSEGLAVKHLSTPRTATPAYLSTVPGTDDAIVLHADVEAITSIVTVLIQSEASPEDVELVTSVLKQLGLSNIKAITARAGFDGPDMVSESLVEMPSPRTGLFANLKPIDMQTFAAVDAGAMNATAVNCDLGGMYDTVLGAIKTAAGEDFAEVEQGIAEVESELKFKIRQGLLESLSGEMMFYTLPSGASAQSPMGGFVLIARLRDKQLWEESITAAGEFAAAVSGGMVQVSSQEQDGRTLHTWAVMPLAMVQIMPTWTVDGKGLIIGSNPAICTRAIEQFEQLRSGGKSIRDTEGFKKVTAGLPANLISFRYSDSKLQFTQLMTVLQQFWPMATMFATKAELKLPMILPNLSHIAQDMGPTCQYSWFDDRGLRSRYRGPGLEPSLGGIAGAAVGAGILMPAMARARHQARNVASMANLKNLGLAMHMYADDHDGKFPDGFEQMRDYYKNSRFLESPQKPTDFEGPSYIYVKGHSTKAGSPYKMIIVYENPEYLRDNIPVLFLDGHVEKMSQDRFIEALERTYKQLGREMPEIKFNR